MTDDRLHNLMADIRNPDFNAGNEEVPYSPVPRGLSSGPGRFAGTLPMMIGGAIFGLLMLGGIGFWVYSLGVETGKSRVPPLIRAQAEAEKVRPDQPGGDQIPHQDKQLFEMIEKAGTEEDEVALNTAGISLGQEAEAPVTRDLETETVPESQVKDFPPVDSAPAGEVVELPLDRVQREEIDQAELENAVSLMEQPPEDLLKLAEAESDREVPPVAAVQMPDVVAPVAKDKARDVPVQDKMDETSHKPEPEAETVVIEATPEEEKLAALEAEKPETVIVSSSGAVRPGGPWLVQLASFKSVESAQKSWDRLSMKFELIMTGAEMDVQEAKIKDKGIWYRLRADGFSSQGDALRFCNQLKEKKQDCLVVRR